MKKYKHRQYRAVHATESWKEKTMSKKLQVFISSTYTDLIEERQKAVEAVLDAGHIPAGMELFKAGKTQMETIKKWIDESDVYCLILGGRYGSVEEESQRSYTQLEYEYAAANHKPLFTIVLDDSMIYRKASENPNGTFMEEGENRSKYEKFKEDAGKKIYKVAYNLSDIATHMHAQLNSILNDPSWNLSGWVKGSTIIRQDGPGLTDEQREAIRKADRKIEESRQAPYAYMERAELLASMGKNYLQRAVPDYLYAIFLDPGYSKAYYNMIQRLSKGGDYVRALRYAEEACRLFPNEGDAYGCRAYVKCAKKLYKDSIVDCNQAISFRANRWFYNTRGRCYLGMNQLHEALNDFVTANRLDSSYTPAVENAGTVVGKIGLSNVINTAVQEKEKGNFEKAKIYLEGVMLADPANERGLQECGGWYYDRKQFSEALDYWKKALDVHRSCQNCYLCAVACSFLHRNQSAEEYCNRALSCPDDGYYERVKKLQKELRNNPQSLESHAGAVN